MMSIPYVYKITHKGTGQYYIGFSQGTRQIGIDYYTSSADEFIKESYTADNQHLWDTEILTTHPDPEEAYWIEQDMIASHIDDDLCLNSQYYRRDSGRKVMLTTPESEMKKIQAMNTPTVKAKMSASQKRRFSDPEQRERTRQAAIKAQADGQALAKARATNATPEVRAKRTAQNLKRWSPEYRKKMSEAQAKKWAERRETQTVACIHCHKSMLFIKRHNCKKRVDI